MIFDAQLPQAVLFKKVAESMKDLCKEAWEGGRGFQAEGFFWEVETGLTIVWGWRAWMG